VLPAMSHQTTAPASQTHPSFSWCSLLIVPQRGQGLGSGGGWTPSRHLILPESGQGLLILNESIARPISDLSSCCIKIHSWLTGLGNVSDGVRLDRLFRGRGEGSVILQAWHCSRIGKIER